MLLFIVCQFEYLLGTLCFYLIKLLTKSKVLATLLIGDLYMNTGILTLNQDFNITGCNDQLLEMFGYELTECCGEDLGYLIPDFDIQTYISDQKKFHETAITLHGNTKVNDTITIKAIVDIIEQTDTTTYLLQLNEVSGLSSQLRQQNRQQQLQGDDWLNYLLHSSPVVVYSCVPSGDFPTTFISQNIKALTGYSTNEYLSDRSFWLEHLHPDEKDSLLIQMASLFDSTETQSHSFEYRFLCADNRYIWVLDKLKISRDSYGCPTEMVGLWLDITQRKKDEESLNSTNLLLKQKTDALTESNKDLSQFTYVVSHDLKAPLRAIHSYCDWLTDDLDDLEEEQQEYIDGMQDAVQQAEALIDDLLELSRVGRREADIEKIALSEFLTELAESALRACDVQLEIDNTMPSLSISPTILSQVFQNLITNAYTYNNSEPKRIEITGSVEGDSYIVSVKDNGIGIAPAFHERVFQLFQRLHTKEEFDGTGIGLAIVQKAVSHLNWNLGLESELNQGATFSVSIPIEEVFND